MSRAICRDAILGAKDTVAAARAKLSEAMQAKGAEHPVQFPDTNYYLPVIYALRGDKIEKLADLQAVLDYCSQIEDITEAGGMRENAARARKYRGEALIAIGDFESAKRELEHVAKTADEIGGVRLQWEAHAALEKLYQAWGKDAAAEVHRARVIAIVNQIRDNLKDDELKAGLPNFGDTGQ